MTVLINSLMAPHTSIVVATVLGFSVCAFTALIVLFGGDPKPQA
jgi:hypothetical protein